MSAATVILILLMLLGILGRSNVIAAAAAFLLLLQFTSLQRFYPILERRALEAGLIFLVVSVLVPFASGRVAPRDMLQSFVSLPGLIAIASGIIATHMNCQGLELLQRFPQMMIGMVIGSIIGVAFFGGIPVGPLMAGGIAALLVHLMAWLR
ncbi:DUF441 domain-containing protein [Neomoorella thermoacetica]|uniref:UPF0756 membrane protein Moth_0120 n=2 Tax=Neomoorella thermoacetica TaxID=1525 RepID=Y120_MOOTA|nr:DUF441 domain-containing protein [Moorella thermoacetica]Q2RM80.1 RecName: Full=UPF0756 membrane protein Moth_0120 [Moorella thermoacetica ATCC 39073]AKX95502.1 hypothetical protein MOTHA_c01260 [Moorella thermoacetica]AOQ22619.1 hypothetical protein Maut_00126 [Moorella thermoacetica]APC07310.1 hypothetical protein MTJW_01220 [Moorella thermoacetica]OIQ10305.1 hypothetical protein MOOR_03870 [Moorella thermoacetica]OIQ11986.1 hypothetical protein MOOTH_11500 [Moorella thermoacetica]